MQPLDPSDPRRVGIQVEASIRAAILSGELQPGEKLLPRAELAKFFGVSDVTIHRAIQTLVAEGFVTSRSGAGTFVRDQAAHPVPEGERHELAGTADLLFEAGFLKHTPRTGWLLLGMGSPESVAEHSFRVGMVGMVLAALEGADAERTAALALFHDFHETRIGDIASVGRAYVNTPAPEAITTQQTAGTTPEITKLLQGLTAEYEAGRTLESRVAHDADKLETLLQAAEYASQGWDTAAWSRTSIEALRTESAKQLARAITAADPAGWFEPFQRSYHELRASTRGREDGT